jgi:hypothetical protein
VRQHLPVLKIKLYYTQNILAKTYSYLKAGCTKQRPQDHHFFRMGEHAESDRENAS